MTSSEQRDHRHSVRVGRDAISAVKLSQQLTADIDAWAEAHGTVRSDAIRRLVEIGLQASSFQPGHGGQTIRDHEREIEEAATAQVGHMLDPALPAEERARRTRRLIDGPPEFPAQRIDLPKHDK